MIIVNYNWFLAWHELETAFLGLGIEPKSIRGKRDRFARVLEEFQTRAEDAAFADKTFGIVVDECDLVSSRGEIMEAIRGISDIRFLPTILVGMGSLRDNLRRFQQIESRAPNKVEFRPSTEEDARLLIEACCDVPVAPDLIHYVWKVSRGYNREILEAIAHIERFGLRQGGDVVTLADMAGQIIMNDRTTGKPIIISGKI